MTKAVGSPLQFEEIADRAAKQDVMHAYARFVDSKDWPRWASLFMEDAFIDYTSSGGAKGSVVDMKKWLKSTFQLFSASQHMLTNFIFDWGPEGHSHASHQSTSCHV